MGRVSASMRQEAPSDAAAIRAVLVDAFETPAEADLVERLREAGALVLSMVAVLDGEVVAHVAYSPVTIGDDDAPAIGLAPVAVLGAHQRRGLGGALIRASLDRLRELGHRVVVLLGSPDYYPRFGFVPAARHDVGCEYDAPPECFMLLELVAGAAAGLHGTARYHPAFAGL